ncbi:apolipoprotein N-acyltransferase [Desulfopila sp. IMCC35008]|uniref:apolipoprotein N-acyltransferase n=1 Tax=Desulfopila sp. IMCC35008 TaxID=2653858 RepID=UPI0013D41413|nr:apolipoprotein N-acyltransferase [Desulfopila sp. IMCC35008]
MSVARFRLPFLGFVTPLLIWLAFPGGGELWLLLAVALVPFILCLYSLTGKQAFVLGYLVGLACYGLQLYWLVTVLSKYGGLPLFIAVPVLFLLLSYMAVYMAIFGWCGSLMLRHFSPLALLVGLPSLWVGLDWLRSFLFSGFPWMDLGYGVAGVPLLVQSADLFGHHLLTFLLLLLNTQIVLLILRWQNRTENILPMVVTISMIGVVAAYSTWRQGDVDRILQLPGTEVLSVGVVQGNIDQSMKWSPDQQQRTVGTYLAATDTLVAERNAELVVWPETALPFYPTAYPGMYEMYNGLARSGTAVLTGAPWYEIADIEKRQINYFNSAQLYLPDGSIAGSYYKSHLVPFGEYVPLKRFLPFLAPLVEAVGDFSPGRIEGTLDFGNARIGVLICFESIFGDMGRKWVEKGANVLVNLTNDAWYGRSSAPYHSMAMTVLRAVETRRSIVRSANTGISGFIDPLGRVEGASEIFTPWSGARTVPLLTQTTMFVRWGYLFGPLCCLCGFGLVAVIWVRKKRSGGEKGS